MIKVRLRRNGPYVIEADDVTVVDWNGTPFRIDRTPVALCRCGASGRKPFCDGTHRTNGFVGDEAADAETTGGPPPGDPS